jgi:6-phosphogluconolactonase
VTIGEGAVRPDVEVLPNAAALADSAAEQIATAAARAIGASGRCVLALSGGATPRRTYERLAQEPFLSRIEWSSVHVIWGDERCVPPGDADSNYRMAWETLLEHVPVPAANIHRIHGEDDPVEAAASYEKVLRDLLRTANGAPSVAPGRRIDLAILGLGDNGHTASLFPESAAARETERWVMAESVDASPSWRITLTAPVLNAATELLFIVSGNEKAKVLSRVLEGPRRPHQLPAQLIAPTHGRVHWLVESAAATELAKSP